MTPSLCCPSTLYGTRGRAIGVWGKALNFQFPHYAPTNFANMDQMMRAIEPDTEYRIYTVRLAVPLRLGETAACDAINETLGPCVGAPEDANRYWLTDYETLRGETVLSDSDPATDDAVREALGLPRRRPFRTRQCAQLDLDLVDRRSVVTEGRFIAAMG